MHRLLLNALHKPWADVWLQWKQFDFWHACIACLLSRWVDPKTMHRSLEVACAPRITLLEDTDMFGDPAALSLQDRDNECIKLP